MALAVQGERGVLSKARGRVWLDPWVWDIAAVNTGKAFDACFFALDGDFGFQVLERRGLEMEHC